MKNTFGKLLEGNKPVLIGFYNEELSKSDDFHNAMNDAAEGFGDSIKVIKIDMVKNKEFAEAMQITFNPCFIVYNLGELNWRTYGVKTFPKVWQCLKELTESTK